jgi:hypothetical protein
VPPEIQRVVKQIDGKKETNCERYKKEERDQK